MKVQLNLLGKETCDSIYRKTLALSEKKEIYVARTTAWIVATTPVFMALLGWLVLKEGLNIIKIIGILLAFIGLLLVSSHGNVQSSSGGKFGEPGFMIGTRQLLSFSAKT